MISFCVSALLVASPPHLPEPQRWVLVRAAAEFAQQKNTRQDDGPTLDTTLRSDQLEQMPIVALVFVADRGSWLEVETPGTDADPEKFCWPTASENACNVRHALGGYRLRGWVRKLDVLRVIRERLDLHFRNGTAAVVQPGIPTWPEGLPDGGNLAHFRGLAPSAVCTGASGNSGFRRVFSVPVKPGALAYDFAPPTTERVPSTAEQFFAVRDVPAAQLGDEEAGFRGQDEHFPLKDVQFKGNSAFVKLRDRCETLTVKLPAAAVEKRVGLRDLSSCPGDEGACPGAHDTWRVAAGAEVYWPDGTLCGETTREDLFDTKPREAGDVRCFDIRPDLLPTRPLCFRPEALEPLGPAAR